MDGGFVPNITLGPCVISSIRKTTERVFDVHLMINEPIRYLKDFSNAGADIITVHYEACKDVEKTVKEIKKLGKKAGIAVKPKTDAELLLPLLCLCDTVTVMTVEPGFGGQALIPETLEKVKKIREMIDEAQRILFELNNKYHEEPEVRRLFSQLTGIEVEKTFRLRPPVLY